VAHFSCDTPQQDQLIRDANSNPVARPVAADFLGCGDMVTERQERATPLADIPTGGEGFGAVAFDLNKV
jgi:hypothetical protein